MFDPIPSFYRLGDFIQPKNCEISNSGGNIFCETADLSKDHMKKSSVKSAHLKLTNQGPADYSIVTGTGSD